MPTPCEHLEGLTPADFPRLERPARARNASPRGRSGGAPRVPDVRPRRLLRRLTATPRRRTFAATQHPVMRTVPGAFTWCYVHEVMGRLPPPEATSPT